MKNLLLLIPFLCLLMACGSDATVTAEAAADKITKPATAAAKKLNEAPKTEMAPPAADYTGNWSFKVTDTPDGDYTGDMVINKDGDGFTGKLTTSGTDIKMEKIKISGTKMEFVINFQGNYPKISGNFTDGLFNGTVGVQGTEFDFSAFRKK